jgi:hypothetical protein
MAVAVVASFMVGLLIDIGVGRANEQLDQFRNQQYKKMKTVQNEQFWNNFMNGTWRTK